MTTRVEPERELVRRLLPLAVPAVALAVVGGALLGGPGAAASAATGVVAVAANLVMYAGSVSWAARISAAAVMIVGLGGYVVRIATFTVGLVLLNGLAWFSPIAFVAAFAPATVAVLVIEMKLLGGPMQADLWYFRERA